MRLLCVRACAWLPPRLPAQLRHFNIAMRSSHLLVLAAAAATASTTTTPGCRCLPEDACWASVPWAALNASVGGRLLVGEDPLSPCLADASSPTCAALLNATDDEFWVTDQALGYLHTGLFAPAESTGGWNLTQVLASYVVAAESTADVQAAVAFASAHNLRLVVKNTGHSWFGTSAARGSLLVWTHRLNGTAFESNFTTNCSATGGGVDVVRVGAGVQFASLYAAAFAVGKQVIGGTCDSVGVGGCWLSGCYGTMSKLYGSGASNVIEMTVVLADGSARVVNACSEPELFWGLRGGGQGLAGVVTEFVALTFPAPSFFLLGGGTFSTTDFAAYERLLEVALVTAKGFQTPAWGGGAGFGYNLGSSPPSYYVSFWPKGFETEASTLTALLQPLVDFVNSSAPGTYHASTSSSYWFANQTGPNDPLPWIERHPDREISTALLRSYSRLPTLSQLSTAGGVTQMAQALAAMSALMPNNTAGISPSLDFEKGQAGASPDALARLATTSVNPVVADALGLLLVMYNVPSLPTVPVTTPAILAGLWPRLKEYIILGPQDPLYATCEDGAGGNATAATACWDEWLSGRVPGLQAQLEAANQVMLAAFPNEAPDGTPVSGTYQNEADFEQADWAAAQWGEATYARLLRVKAAYDPDGLFVCHHCVGSEAWTPDGNCRVNATATRRG